MSNIHYLVLSDNPSGQVDMDGAFSFTEMADALNAAYALYKINVGISAIIAMDVTTGEVFIPECRNREQTKRLLWHFEETDLREEAEYRRYGSYADEHRLRAYELVSL